MIRSKEQSVYEGDPHLVGVDPKTLANDCYESEKLCAFGLPLISAWRSFPTSLAAAYQVLAARVSSRFVSTTGQGAEGNNQGNDDPEAHIYPFADLHVTIVSFRTLLDPAPADEERAEAIKNFCSNVVENATKKDVWPKGDIQLQLRPKDICLWKKNAVILWEETTGNLDAMRRCIKEEMDAHGVDPPPGVSLFVPDIVPSTFLRFWKRIDGLEGSVSSDPEILKQTFEGSDLLDILPKKIDVDPNAKLVCEDRPCMRIRSDDSHVLWEAE